MKAYFTEEDIEKQISMWKGIWYHSLIFREMQIQMRYHLVPSQLVEIKANDNTKWWWVFLVQVPNGTAVLENSSAVP